MILNPFRTAAPFWGQTTWNFSGLSPKRDCSPKREDRVVGLGAPRRMQVRHPYRRGTSADWNDALFVFCSSVFFFHFDYFGFSHFQRILECVCRARRIQYNGMTFHGLLCVLHNNAVSRCRGYMTTELISL